jgi:hypothetical protein
MRFSHNTIIGTNSFATMTGLALRALGKIGIRTFVVTSRLVFYAILLSGVAFLQTSDAMQIFIPLYLTRAWK